MTLLAPTLQAYFTTRLTSQFGASPQTMAAAIAGPLENELMSINGLQSIISDNTPGSTKITLTFELVYGHAFRPRTERARDGAATFDLEQLRNTARQPGLPAPQRRR